MALSRTTSPEGHDAMSSSDLSQPDTEPLPFDEEEEDRDQDGDGGQESQVEGDGDGDQEMVDGENGDQQHNPQSQSQADAEMESESELDNQNGSNNQIESNQSSPLKATTAFTQDEFSGSDLTDPNDDDDEEEDDEEEDSEDDQVGKSRGRSKGKWNKANRRQTEEEEEEEGEDGDGLQDQSPENAMESTTRNNSEDQEGVEGEEEEDDDEEEDRNSNSSRDSSNYDSEDPTSINSNRLRRATRSRAPINSNRGKKNGAAAGTRKSKPRRSSGRSSGDGGGGASNIPSGAVPVTLTNPNNKSSSSSTTNTTTGTRGRGRGRGRGSRGRGRGTNSSSRGGANAGISTREGTAATDTQQETDLETNAEDDNEDEDPNVEGGGSGKRRRVSSEDEAEGLDGLAALATTTTASNNNNGSNGKIKGRSSRGMSGGMGMLANAPQISIVGGDEEEEEQAEDLLSASARTSREVSMNPDALLEDLQVEAEARENEEGVRKLKGQKTNDGDSSRKDPSSSLNVIDPSIANVDGTSPAVGGAGASTSATGAGTGIGEVEETGGLMADSDLAAQHRQEALEQLTKIEIMFAKLRDRLYIERMEELRKEAEMVLEGTHPDLIKLTNIIENQRDNRLKLVEAWLEKEEICVEEIARADEESSWSSWRNDAVELRRTMMDETARKKRRLDREKRTLDVPRPTRRYQAFEAELTPNPRFDPSTRINENPTTSSSSRQATNPTISRKKAGKQRAVQPMEQDSEYQMQMELDNDLLAGAGQVRAGEFVAYPGLRGLESNDVWNDLETMGIAPLPAGYSHNLYSTGVDPYSGGATNGYYYEEPQVSNSNPYEPYPSYETNRAPPPRTSNSNINVFGPDHPSHHAFVGNHQPIVPPRTNQDHSMDRDLEREREREREMFEKERERERIREKELKRERNRVQQQQQQHSTPISSSSSSYLTNGNGNQSSRMSNQQMTSSFSSHPNQLPPPPPPPPTSSLKAGSSTSHLHQHPHSSSAHNGRDLNGQMEMGH